MNISISPPSWVDHSHFLTSLASVDLEHGSAVRPTLVAYRDELPLFCCSLRPARNSTDQATALIEAGAAASAINANQIAVSFGGKAWSSRDPIPPVCDRGDMRQAVITIHSIDVSHLTRTDLETAGVTPRVIAVPDRPTRTGLHAVMADQPVLHTILPVEFDRGLMKIGRRVPCDNAESWITNVLQAAAVTSLLPTTTEEMWEQVDRCESLGHEFAWNESIDELRSW